MVDFFKKKEILSKELEGYLIKDNLKLFDINWMKDFGTNVLQVLVEDRNQIIDLDRLTLISEEINTIVDHLDLFDEDYALEVSTPGAERPLRNFEELKEQLGKEVYLELREGVNNCHEVSGKLSKIISETQEITIQYFKKGAPKEFQTRYSNVKNARCAIKF